MGDILLRFTLIFFPTMVLCVLNLHPFEKVFTFSPFVYLGKISMSTFLVHVPILNLFGIINHKLIVVPFNTIPGFCVIMLSVFFVSVFWYYLIEQRLIPTTVKFINSHFISKE